MVLAPLVKSICSPVHRLSWAIAFGCVATVIQEIHFYSTGGCADERKAREDYGHAISNQMCCHTEWAISGIGFGLCGFFCLAAVWKVFATRRGLGRCCCCFRGGLDTAPYLAALLGITASGLILLTVAQMCWSLLAHGIGAVTFFFCGTVMIAVINFSARGQCCARAENQPSLELEAQAQNAQQSEEESVRSRFTRISALVLGVVAAGVTLADPFVAEWIAIAAIALAVLHLQVSVLVAEEMDPTSEETQAPGVVKQDAPDESNPVVRDVPNYQASASTSTIETVTVSPV
eukprot:TRINITY_DN874_c0_g1_i2.p1 TRINITY_DN874_c0_g1~~TRINITY_DN874_c0_g1_i2.p1  ORF type:complete len:290 (-),score=45.63 TRINITY_DN874_c0_g1_i2:74-943(-)